MRITDIDEMKKELERIADAFYSAIENMEDDEAKERALKALEKKETSE